MSANPLLELFLATFPNPTLGNLDTFIAGAVADAGNYELFDEITGAAISSDRSIFYSGNVAGAFGGNIAVDLAHRASEPTRVIDDTKIGRFFGSISNGGALNDIIDGASPEEISHSVPWFDASKKFAETAKGNVTILLGDTAKLGGDFATAELPALLKNSAIGQFNNIPAANFLAELTSTDLSDAARDAYFFGRLSADSAIILHEHASLIQ